MTSYCTSLAAEWQWREREAPDLSFKLSYELHLCKNTCCQTGALNQKRVPLCPSLLLAPTNWCISWLQSLENGVFPLHILENKLIFIFLSCALEPASSSLCLSMNTQLKAPGKKDIYFVLLYCSIS